MLEKFANVSYKIIVSRCFTFLQKWAFRPRFGAARPLKRINFPSKNQPCHSAKYANLIKTNIERYFDRKKLIQITQHEQPTTTTHPPSPNCHGLCSFTSRLHLFLRYVIVTSFLVCYVLSVIVCAQFSFPGKYQ